MYYFAGQAQSMKVPSDLASNSAYVTDSSTTLTGAMSGMTCLPDVVNADTCIIR